ncbi:CAP domain-containing protein [Alkalibacillus almallahensis]|uniref:CAP domain-containing protein n=1 Tax=Alkalibacillus almallahensis TaxID=1379154 RepID=UPI001FB8F03A|nr:CAP domain-containing protein [Alkalibacillus almallahensis]NIK13277.1 putative YkwD family protein [Alkalibacillus almallahensis]
MRVTKWLIGVMAIMLLLTACQEESEPNDNVNDGTNMTDIGFTGDGNGNNQADRDTSDNRNDANRFQYENNQDGNQRGDGNRFVPFNFFDREGNPDPGQTEEGQRGQDNTNRQQNGQGQGENDRGQQGQQNGQEQGQNEARNNETNNGQESGDVTTNQSMVDEVIRLTNAKREENGLSPLKHDSEVTDVAQRKSVDMADQNYFSHQSPTYGSPFDMLDQFNVSYTAAGENIAAGQSTAEKVVNSWMNSKGHRENILNDAFTHIGIGYEDSGRMNPYWTQMFIAK